MREIISLVAFEVAVASCVIGSFAGSALPSVNVCNCQHKKAS